jgi:hypothetical protein
MAQGFQPVRNDDDVGRGVAAAAFRAPHSLPQSCSTIPRRTSLVRRELVRNEERPHSAIGNKAPIELINRSVACGSL